MEADKAMDAQTMRQCLRESMHIEKEIVALRQVNVEPAHIEPYGDKNHICYMMGEVPETGRTFYTTLEDHVCLLGCQATGLDPDLDTMDAEELRKSEHFHVAAINIFPSAPDINATNKRPAAVTAGNGEEM